MSIPFYSKISFNEKAVTLAIAKRNNELKYFVILHFVVLLCVILLTQITALNTFFEDIFFRNFWK